MMTKKLTASSNRDTVKILTHITPRPLQNHQHHNCLLHPGRVCSISQSIIIMCCIPSDVDLVDKVVLSSCPDLVLQRMPSRI